MERILGMAESLDHRLYPGNVAVVIGTPDVDELREAPGKLVPVVGYVRGEIGVLAVLLDDDPVLVITEGSGLEPKRAGLFIGKAALFKLLNGALDRIVRKKTFLAEP